jgi:hypothetical protein
MFMAMAAAVIVLSAVLFGGELRLLAELRLRLLPLLYVALATQVVITELPGSLPTGAMSALHVATYGLAAVVVWANRRVPGIVVLWLGTSLNLLAIAANGGTMPATASALRAAGLQDHTGFANSGSVDGARLSWLGDTMATPSWLPLRNVISVGDLVILLGAGILVHVTCRSRDPRPGREPRRAAGQQPARAATPVGRAADR